MRLKPLILMTLLALSISPALAQRPMSFEDIARLRSVGSVDISPDGRQIAYTLSVPRDLEHEDDGNAWTELRLVAAGGGASRPYIQGAVNVSGVRFSPDGRHVTFLAKREGDEHRSLYAIPVAGGESRKLLEFESNVIDYRLHPSQPRVAFIAVPADDEAREHWRDKGYTQEIVEEDWKPRRLWIAALPAFDLRSEEGAVDAEPEALELEGSVYALEWGPSGKQLVVTLAPRPLVDDSYMKKRVRVVDAADGSILTRIENPGKLGAIAVSPDGGHVAMISAADPNDPRDGRLMVAPSKGDELRDLLPGLEAHVTALGWLDAKTLLAVVARGCETELTRVGLDGSSEVVLRSGEAGVPLMQSLSIAGDGKRVAFGGESPTHPREVYSAKIGLQPTRLTDSNPWLEEVAFARQEVIRHEARDGLELEGVLIHPLKSRRGKAAPLIMVVHGGPESHVSNGFMTTYSRPGQLAAGKGYAVFHPNYRGSTGRGVAFSKLGQGDAAGKEFDDLVDAVDHLIEVGVADRERVGITGGSYGGYATAWASTVFTERFKAGVMFVGISNKLSKGFTTDIPVEDKMVHTLFDPWTNWQFSLERSPLYHAEKSRTALLIGVGKEDPRVHPSQSLQMYRALKLIGKTPVRLVQYPGEGHGNRRAASRDDYGRRLMRWFDHFLIDGAKTLPPWNLERYESAEDD